MGGRGARGSKRNAGYSTEKLALEAEFDASSDVIFHYGYGYCAFAQDIRGSKPMIPAGMPDTSMPLPLEFFMNP